jgi:hypothetical protein
MGFLDILAIRGQDQLDDTVFVIDPADREAVPAAAAWSS